MEWQELRYKNPPMGVPIVLIEMKTNKMCFGINRCIAPECYLEPLNKKKFTEQLDFDPTHFVILPQIDKDTNS